MASKVSIGTRMCHRIVLIVLVSTSASLLSAWLFTPVVLTNLITSIQHQGNDVENNQHATYTLLVDNKPLRNYREKSTSSRIKILTNAQRNQINTPIQRPPPLTTPSVPTLHPKKSVKANKVTSEHEQQYYSTMDFYTNVTNITGVSLPVNLIHFSPPLNFSQVQLARKVFFASTKLLRKLDVPYTLTQGSLVGSYLHHNMIPWDDDLDVIVDEKYQDKLKTAFVNDTISIDGIKLKIKLGGTKIWKIYLDMERTKSATFSNPFWPFLDMFPYKDNGTHLVQNVRPCHAFPKAKMYPIQHRPFEGSLQPVPCDTEYVLRRMLFKPKFDEICKSRGYSHLLRKASALKAVPCAQLFKFYPFVRRTTSPYSPFLFEALYVNNTKLGEYKFEIPACGPKLLKPYPL